MCVLDHLCCTHSRFERCVLTLALEENENARGPWGECHSRPPVCLSLVFSFVSIAVCWVCFYNVYLAFNQTEVPECNLSLRRNWQ